ncbi:MULTISPECIES: helix-turn-helix domain-containing protein [Parachlamydia]
MTLQELEKRLIIETLQAQHNNRTKTAEVLGISVRTLRNKLNEYNMKNER